MIKDSSKNKNDKDKKQVFNDRYHILEWLLDTQSSNIYIGNILCLYLISGRDSLTQESVLIKFVILKKYRVIIRLNVGRLSKTSMIITNI